LRILAALTSNVPRLSATDATKILWYQNNRLTGNITDGAPTGVLAVR